MAFRTQAAVVLDPIFTLTSMVLAIVVATSRTWPGCYEKAVGECRWRRDHRRRHFDDPLSWHVRIPAQPTGYVARALGSTLATSVGAGLWSDHRNAGLQGHDHSCGCYRQSARSNGWELRAASVLMVESPLRRETVKAR